MREIFAPFGLIHEIKQFDLEKGTKVINSLSPLQACNYAFVKYYSRRAALDAKHSINGISLHGRSLRVTLIDFKSFF